MLLTQFHHSFISLSIRFQSAYVGLIIIIIRDLYSDMESEDTEAPVQLVFRGLWTVTAEISTDFSASQPSLNTDAIFLSNVHALNKMLTYSQPVFYGECRRLWMSGECVLASCFCVVWTTLGKGGKVCLDKDIVHFLISGSGSVCLKLPSCNLLSRGCTASGMFISGC